MEKRVSLFYSWWDKYYVKSTIKKNRFNKNVKITWTSREELTSANRELINIDLKAYYIYNAFFIYPHDCV